MLALEVAESSMDAAGRQPLSPYELQLLQQAGRGDEQSLRRLEADLQGLPRQ